MTTNALNYALAPALAMGLLAAPCRAHEGDQSTIVVTATGTALLRDESGQAISMLDAAAIERSQAVSVVDSLARLPSVRVNSTGSLGSVTGVSLRGAEIGQTLVLIDGVRVNDPSSTTDAVDFGNLLTGNIRRIEVMRGSNAIPFGSEAIGGVIDISTRDADAPDGLSLRAAAESGYAGTFRGGADLGWRSGALRIDGGLAALRTDGISSADRQLGATERDGLENWTGHARVEVPITDQIGIDLRAYAVEARLNYDSFFGAPADSGDNSLFRQITSYAGLNISSLGGKLTSLLAVTYLANRRDYSFVPGAPVDFGYRGSNRRLEYRGKLSILASADMLLGYSHEAPDYRFFGFGSDERHSSATDSGYAMLVLRPLARLSITAGARHDEHSQFGGVTTFGANGNFGLADGKTRIRAAYGEGFRVPSLYQLYDGYSGNRSLAPERSESFDFGLDRKFAGGRGNLALTIFTRMTRNQIDFDNATFTFANRARTRAAGLEVELAVRPADGLDLALAYSLIDTRDRSPGSASFGRHLPRRAVHGLNLSVDKRWHAGMSTGATVRMASNSVDPLAPGGSLEGHVVADLRAAWDFGGHYELFGRLENVFNASYETAYGYGTYGRAAYVGVRLKL